MTVVTQLLIAAAIVFLAWTLYLVWREAVRAGRSRPDQLIDESHLRQLLEEKRIILASIKATELDHETGKISDADFERLRDEAMERAIALMREIDEVRSGFRYDSQVEKDLQEMAEEPAPVALEPATVPAADGELIVLDMQAAAEPSAVGSGGMSEARQIRLARRRERTDPNEPAPAEPARLPSTASKVAPASSCPSCDSPIEEGDKFCSECGAPLRASCPSCGARQRLGAKFCSECGTSLVVKREAKA